MGKREYQKHEFCRAVNCEDLSDNNFCESDTTTCCHTAKEFHSWLQRNGFKIVKETPDKKGLVEFIANEDSPILESLHDSQGCWDSEKDDWEEYMKDMEDED